MGQSGGHSTHKSADISPQLVGHRLCAFLRRQHPRKTVERVAADTGIPRTTVAKWIEREGAPSVPALLKLAMVYGPDVLEAVAPELWWLAVAVKVTRAKALGQALDRADAELAETFDTLRGRR